MTNSKSWESDLLRSTQEFVAKVCPDLEHDRRDDVVAKVYGKMHRTLRAVYQGNGK